MNVTSQYLNVVDFDPVTLSNRATFHNLHDTLSAVSGAHLKLPCRFLLMDIGMIDSGATQNLI